MVSFVIHFLLLNNEREREGWFSLFHGNSEPHDSDFQPRQGDVMLETCPCLMTSCQDLQWSF